MFSWLVAPLLLFATAPSPAPDDGQSIELVDSGFSAPLYVTAPAGDQRIFVVERGGKVKIVLDGKTLNTPYLDLGSLLPTSPGPEVHSSQPRLTVAHLRSWRDFQREVSQVVALQVDRTM